MTYTPPTGPADPQPHGATISVELGRSVRRTRYCELSLMDTRAADDLRVSYDYERDGWKLEQATVHSWESNDPICDRGWVETAFCPANRQRAAAVQAFDEPEADEPTLEHLMDLQSCSDAGSVCRQHVEQLLKQRRKEYGVERVRYEELQPGDLVRHEFTLKTVAKVYKPATTDNRMVLIFAPGDTLSDGFPTLEIERFRKATP